MKHEAISEVDLHAYVDGLLPAARQAELQAYLLANPAEQEKIEQWRQQNAGLRKLFEGVLDEAVPAHLRRQPQPQLQPQLQDVVRQVGWGWQHLAAALALVFVSGAGGWLLHAGSADSGLLARAGLPAVRHASAFAHQAAVAHLVYSPDVRRPVEIAAEQEGQLLTWLSKRMNSPMRAPRLGKLAYELVGGRLLPGASGPVAQFMYQDASGQRLTLYVTDDQLHNQDTGFQFLQDGKVNVFYWVDGKFGYALSGSISKAELARIATAVYEQLDKPSQVNTP